MQQETNIDTPSEVKIFNTQELLKIGLFDSMIGTFNKVFSQNVSREWFFNFFTKNPDGFSYHAVIVKNNQVVASCSAILYHYKMPQSLNRFGVLVSLFVDKMNYRDPFALYKMYEALKIKMIENKVCLIYAVPNQNSYPYFKKVLKFTDIGKLEYYCLPIKIANILQRKPAFLNSISKAGVLFWLIIKRISLLINNRHESKKAIQIVNNDALFRQQRYSSSHKISEDKNGFFSYTVVLEGKIKTAYILDFYSKAGIKDRRTLINCIFLILKNEDVDIILFVGKLDRKIDILFKVPVSKEPKSLVLSGEVYDKNLPIDALNFKNWDFGLLNFDTR